MEKEGGTDSPHQGQSELKALTPRASTECPSDLVSEPAEDPSTGHTYHPPRNELLAVGYFETVRKNASMRRVLSTRLTYHPQCGGKARGNHKPSFWPWTEEISQAS